MKTVYLLDENGNDVDFNYTNISDLKEELLRVQNKYPKIN